MTLVEIEQGNGTWATISPDSIYTVSGLNYTLINRGASGMFRYSEPVDFEPIKDTEILVQYLRHIGDTVRASTFTERPRFLIVRK